MTPIRIPHWQVEQRAAERPPGYLDEIAPALLYVCDGGCHTYDQDHWAWKIALHKYRNVARIPANFDPTQDVGCGCDPPARE